MHLRLTDDDLQAAREAYAYPPARLVIAGKGEPADVEWPGIIRLRIAFDPDAWKRGAGRDGLTSVELDRVHRTLLTSNRDADLLYGLASVQYWGNAWDPRGKPLRFALKRVKWLTCGKAGKNASPPVPQPVSEILQSIKETRA